MSKIAKLSFFIAVVIVVVIAVVQILTSAPWLNLYTVAMYVAACLVIAGVAVDYKFYMEFLGTRTTKNGMNMGATIIITLVLLVCVNYLANLHNKTWDVTQEKLNSLSDQSAGLVKGLNDDIQITVFNSKQAQAQTVSQLKGALNLFTESSPHFKVRYLNQYSDPGTAEKYLNGLQDQGIEHTFVFAERGDKRVRVESPFDEGAITSALIKLTRTGESKIYFLTGHGEKDIHGAEAQGLKDFVKSLGESSFKVESLSLMEQKEVPKDAAAVAIIGPAVQYLDTEIKALREYAQNGGHFFIALDPGQRSNLAGLVKSLGVEFENNYVVMLSREVEGAGTATIVGASFDPRSDVTKSFRNGTTYSLFNLVSELKPAPDKSAGIQTMDLVRSDKYSFTMSDIKEKPAGRPDFKSVTLAMEAKGKIDDKATKDFSAVIFGDSDFISNRELAAGVNRDLGMNAIAALTEQKDLLSIRPKMPKGTMMILTRFAGWMVVILCMLLPTALLISGGIVWFRRRGA